MVIKINDWRIFRDADRYIVGRDSWQGSAVSMTDGVVQVGSRAEAQQMLQEVSEWTEAQAEAERRVYWTDSRFEEACDASRFGPDW